MQYYKYTIFLIIYIVGEAIAVYIFNIIKKWLNIGETDGNKTIAIAAGMIERIVLYSGLVINVQQVIIMFGALKIGTMVSAKKDKGIRTEYFLIGNFISVLLALAYYFAYTKIKHHLN